MHHMFDLSCDCTPMVAGIDYIPAKAKALPCEGASALVCIARFHALRPATQAYSIISIHASN